MDWDDLRYFLGVAEGGGLTPAARALKVNPSTVGRHIDSLEGHLGVRLFDRRIDGYSLTAAGEKLRERASRIAEEVFALNRDFDSEDRALAGPVAVMVPDSLTLHFIVANLGALRARHPGIRIDLIADNRSVNLSRRDADIAIRFVRPEQGELAVRRIGTLGYGLYASPDYLARMGEPTTLAELQEHDLFNFVDDYSHFGPVDWLRRYRGERPPVFRSNNASERLAAARAGLGISLAPAILAAAEPGLVRLLPEAPMPALDIWLLVHRDLARLPRVRAVLDFVAERAQAERGRLSGDRPA